MKQNPPVIYYQSIKIADNFIVKDDEIKLSACKASLQPPYNKIDVQMIPTKNISVSYYEVRITTLSEIADIGMGTLAYWDANIAANETKSFSININSTNFRHGDTTYVISFYAKSAIDGSWDISYLVFTLTDTQVLLKDGSALGVLTTREIPTK